jgi:hypothetical protein
VIALACVACLLLGAGATYAALRPLLADLRQDTRVARARVEQLEQWIDDGRYAAAKMAAPPPMPAVTMAQEPTALPADLALRLTQIEDIDTRAEFEAAARMVLSANPRASSGEVLRHLGIPDAIGV